jgi:hypothetical protein
MTANGFQLYAVVVFIVLMGTIIIKLIKDIFVERSSEASIA